jgi:hypothetical protein
MPPLLPPPTDEAPTRPADPARTGPRAVHLVACHNPVPAGAP